MLAVPPNFRISRGCQKRQTPAKEQDGKVKDLEWRGNPPLNAANVQNVFVWA